VAKGAVKWVCSYRGCGELAELEVEAGGAKLRLCRRHFRNLLSLLEGEAERRGEASLAGLLPVFAKEGGLLRIERGVKAQGTLPAGGGDPSGSGGGASPTPARA